MTTIQGYLALVLHAHLPFVRHPEHEYFLEEDWLFEAITESYIPLLQILESLATDEVPFQLTLSMSPSLVSMLNDDLLRSRYDRYLLQTQSLLQHELKRTCANKQLNNLVKFYLERVARVRKTWEEKNGDLVKAFGRLQDQGHLDILTCAATHGYLPLLQMQPQAVWAQIKIATDHYREVFGIPPKGFWLPECAFFPGLDVMLADAGLRYFVAEGHAVEFARPRPQFGTFAPVYSANSGVAVFPRDQETALQVWSREHGYPGDICYREFYRDIGFDLDLETIGPFLKPPEIRKSTGIKYHRITGNTEDKELYDPFSARDRAAKHADDFVRSRSHQMERIRSQIGRPPIVVAPYDAELFGHWWYEGILWLEFVFRKCALGKSNFRLTHLKNYLKTNSEQQMVEPSQSSWGYRGYHQIWLHESNEWIYPKLHWAAAQMIKMADRWPNSNGLQKRALKQAARELLLAQASDWAFMMQAGTTDGYAKQRTGIHMDRFSQLREQICIGAICESTLSEIENRDNIFPNIDYRVYGTHRHALDNSY
ncbi:MAG: 1,4-alpha-glucan branching protein domain-containing protein [Pseudomonadota bacterium]